MKRFSVEILRPENLFTGNQTVLPEGVTLTPESWSDSARWGYEDARISATGPANEIETLLTWLAARVLIRSEYGSVVWAGRVHEVVVNYGGTAVAVSLDDVYNRVQVAYVARTANGGEETRYTAWAEDADSIAQYGVRELRLTLPEGAAVGANALRDRTLAASAWPAPVLRAGVSGAVRATIYCRSYLEALQRVYYSNPNGLAEYADGSDTQFALNASVASDQFSFSTVARINGPSGVWNALQPGDPIYVAGAAQAENNGLFTVQNLTSATQVRVAEQTIVNAGPGPTIAISWGGGAVTHVAQSFQLPAGATQWMARTVSLMLKRHDPTGVGIAGEIVILLCSDNAGQPGTVLDSKTLTNGEVNALPTALTWVEIDLTAGNVLLYAATTYWVVVHHNTATGLGRHIEVGVNSDLGFGSTLGRVRTYIGGPWVAGGPDFHMPFRVTGVDGTLALIAKMLPIHGVIEDNVVQTTAGHAVWQYRTGERTVWDEADALMEMGSAGGNELILRWGVVPWFEWGRLVIEEQAPQDERAPILGRNGQLRQSNGEPWEPGRLVAGKWVEMDGMPGLAGANTRRRALWVETSRYDAAADTLTLESAGARDPLAGIGRRKG